jgi:hypothetical protein
MSLPDRLPLDLNKFCFVVQQREMMDAHHSRQLESNLGEKMSAK